MKLSLSWRRWMEHLGGSGRETTRSWRGQRHSSTRRRLILESLEDRTLLSAPAVGAGLPALSSLQAPLLGSSALMGGNGADGAHGLAVDSSGNTYIVGDTSSSNFPGAKQTYAGGGDGFVSKLSPSGELLWTTLLGGSGIDSATGIALDDSGTLYVTGYTNSPDFPESGQTNTAGNHAYVSQLNSDGELLWSTLLGNSASGWSIAVASSDDIYLAGSTEDVSFPGAKKANAGNADGFVSKLNSSGDLLWSALVGGSGDDSANSIALDTSGNVYITGFTSSDSFPGATQANAGNYDTFVSKLNSSGELLWSTLLGGSGNDFAYGIAMDASDNAYITGSSESHNFSDSKQANAGGFDAFVSKLNSAGEQLWSTVLGGDSYDFVYSIALDASNNAYITGYTDSHTFSGTKQTNAGGDDAFVSKLNPDGGLLWSLLLGGDKSDLGFSIAVDLSSNIYVVAGLTGSSNFPGPNGTTLPPASGGSDAFVIKLTDQTAPTATVTVSLSGAGVIHNGDGSYSLDYGTVYSVIGHVTGTDSVDLGTPTLTYYPGTDASGDGIDTAPTAPGTYTVVASYAGNGGYPSASARVAFTITQAPANEEPTNPGTPPPAAGASAAQEWNSYRGLYHLLSYQYFSKLGLDPLSSFTWGDIFAQFNVNLGMLKGLSPRVSLILFNHFLSQGGDPYTSSIVATSLTGQGSSFTPASGSPSERAETYYQNLGLALDSLTDLYAHALSLGHPDDAILALIAAQHGASLA